ncbi:PEP-CTERM sorting domain-containing protein [Roseibacillus ishigakijimensis]|uniref:Uncharacterized protein n=1 Tax=Roseibacillus ishigakijimensis TaxID=454146 RepID=A0A934RIW8_9BACT|nr:hypothetical protein [Roseibacillus ishigakijimensis]
MTISPALAGPYEPPATREGSTALSASDMRFVAWASEVVSYQVGAEVSASFQTPENALGPVGGYSSIVTLGRGGSIVLGFAQPIGDGEGPDFAVFENSFSDTFLELAYVEVSVDGVHFMRFASDSLTAAPVPAFGSVDATNITGLAGKYRAGYGTPFDLAELGLAQVSFVRLVDVVGDGLSLDSSEDPIYDPYPTTGSAGFDLDGVGVLQVAGEVALLEILAAEVEEEEFVISWRSQAGTTYAIMKRDAISGDWSEVAEVTATGEETQGRVSMQQTAGLYRIAVK